LPSLSPALLRQLAGMGNNLNQIARQVNAGGGSGHDRVQVVAAPSRVKLNDHRLHPFPARHAAAARVRHLWPSARRRPARG
ncbi:MobC family plasmid mobilization relaxosome protein, partial [Salmonella enterica]|uniref:MobC family plasmid mobilization relaxosome protein n=1 Tax=Salmonella enterica TaxID=28901 RepID=UPI003CCB5342